MAGGRLDEIMAQARAMVADGRGRDLLLMPGWWYAASAESFLDRMVSMPAILDLASRITCPVLFVFAVTRSHRRPIRRKNFRLALAAPVMSKWYRTATTSTSGERKR